MINTEIQPKHKNAYILFDKNEDDGHQVLVFHFRALPTTPHCLMLNTIGQYFIGQYDDVFHGCFGTELKSDYSYLELFIDMDVLTSDQKKFANRFMQDFKHFVELYQFDLTFDETARHLMKPFQATSVYYQLSPVCGFVNPISKVKSSEFVQALKSNSNEFSDSLNTQFTYFHNHSDSSLPYDKFVEEKNDSLNFLFDNNLFLKVFLTEEDDHYLISVNDLSKADTQFIFENLNTLDTEILLHNYQNGFQMAFPKTDENLLQLFNIASAHKLTLACENHLVREKLNSLTSIEQYPVRDVKEEVLNPQLPQIPKAKSSQSFSL